MRVTRGRVNTGAILVAAWSQKIKGMVSLPSYPTLILNQIHPLKYDDNMFIFIH